MDRTAACGGKWLAVMLLVAILLPIASCVGSAAQEATHTIADSIGDWGYPTPYACYPGGPGYVRMQLIFETLV